MILQFRFPRDNVRRKQWELAVNREEKWCSTSYSAVCSEHFEASDFYITDSGLRKLSVDAVPSINISPCQEQKPTICEIDPVKVDPMDSDEVIKLKHKVKRLELLRICLVCLCAFLVVRDGRCEGVDPGEVDSDSDLGRADEPGDQRKDGKASFLPGEFWSVNAVAGDIASPRFRGGEILRNLKPG
ncbi:unnamed protein product [Chilo suppressalis]|uniref:THAP-type domain-containing protein n=1 Tax=Chilo suppressalis TaxID=168631 RepID=A0ABN8BJ65_CHISP|nr:unnamed protein product [Chilo suppressalis]